MTKVPNFNSRIVEALYVEALVLADAARAQFDILRSATRAELRAGNGLRAEPYGAPAANVSGSPDEVEIACEGLRTTTRVMHCLAWLLNHRAWFAGEISAVQLRRHGRLITHFPASDQTIVARLPDDAAELVTQSERLYARIARLELAWRSEAVATPGAIVRLRERLHHAAALMS